MTELRQYEIVEFTTQKSADLDVGPLRIDAELESGMTLAWQSVPNIQQYEIEMRYENISTSTHSRVPYFSFPTLSKRFAYAFRVRAWTSGQGISDWSEPLFYKVGEGVMSKNAAIRAGLSVPRSFSSRNSFVNTDRDWQGVLPSSLWPWLLICSFAVIFFLSILMILTRRANKNRKQMSDLDVLDTYKQGKFSFNLYRLKGQASLWFDALIIPGFI